MRVTLENMRVLTKLCVNHPRIYYNYVGEINVYNNVEMARDRFVNSMRKIIQINFRHVKLSERISVIKRTYCTLMIAQMFHCCPNGDVFQKIKRNGKKTVATLLTTANCQKRWVMAGCFFCQLRETFRPFATWRNCLIHSSHCRFDSAGGCFL